MASSKPRPSSPRIAECGTRTSWKLSDAGPHWAMVGIGAEVQPASRSTRKQVTDPVRPLSILVGDREDHHEVGHVAVGDEGLLPVDHPLVAVADGGGADVAGVRPGAGLGDREAADLVAVDGRDEVALLLLVVGGVEDVVGVAAEAERHERPAELRLHQRRHDRAERHPAVLLRRLHPEEPGLLGLAAQRPQLLAGQPSLAASLALEDGRFQRHDLAGDERAHPVTDLAFFVGQAQVHARTLGEADTMAP